MSRFAQAPRGSQWRSATGEIWTVFERLPFGRLHIVREDNSRQGEVFQRDFLAHHTRVEPATPQNTQTQKGRP